MINKLLLYAVFIAVSAVTLGVVFGETRWVPRADENSLSVYRQLADIRVASTSSIPHVVELALTDLPPGAVRVVSQQDPWYLDVPQVVETTTRTIDAPLTVADVTGEIEPALFDQDPNTTVSFPVREARGQTTVLQLTTAEPVAAIGLQFALARGVVAPQRLTIIALDAVDGEQIVYQSIFPQLSRQAAFPQIIAQTWHVEIAHTQPLVIAEIGLTQVERPVEQERTLRFLAQPDEQYSLYYDSPIVGYDTVGTRTLLDAEQVVPAVLVAERINDEFIEPDTDIDGIPDQLDNCPAIINSDQRDDNQNRQGDACEDFDFDGQLNYRDNCARENNPDQRDTDSDGIGDVCDDEESRLLEQYPWIPWLGLIVASLTIGLLFWLVRRMSPINTNNQN
jgi:hypothetical protein